MRKLLKELLKDKKGEAIALWEMSSAVVNDTPDSFGTIDKLKVRAEVMYRLVRTVIIKRSMDKEQYELYGHAKALQAKGVTFDDTDPCEGCSDCFDGPVDSADCPRGAVGEAFAGISYKHRN